MPECDLVVTLEPCAMCAMALLHARIRRLVFATPDPKTGAAGSVVDLFSQSCLNHQTKVHQGLLANQAKQQLQDFFRQRRKSHHPLNGVTLTTAANATVASAKPINEP